MSIRTNPNDFAAKKQWLAAQLQRNGGSPRLNKSTVSHLFRYRSASASGSGVSLTRFNRVIEVDVEQSSLNVEGLATFETIVEATLAHGLIPLVCPELKHITIGGAIVGIGIESNCFRHGFVHDGLIEAEVLLPDGRVVLARPDNEHAELFRALPNSYGTLGYILRTRMRLMRARPWVHLRTQRFGDLVDFLAAMRAATQDPNVDFTEGLFHAGGPFFLTNSRFEDHVPRVDDIVRRHVFYKLLEAQPDLYLSTRDYLFRYDPEWFWNLPESWPYLLFRRFAPRSLRNSGFYTRYSAWKRWVLAQLPWTGEEDVEPLIQDWEVPWERARELIEFARRETDIGAKPWIVTPLRTPSTPTLYPIEANRLYLNLGCYCQVKKVAGRTDYWYTRILDDKCFALGGIKMLYSSTFLAPEQFWAHYNGKAYWALKQRYDPKGQLKDLYAKCALRV